jgi:hypothetical protein
MLAEIPMVAGSQEEHAIANFGEGVKSFHAFTCSSTSELCTGRRTLEGIGRSAGINGRHEVERRKEIIRERAHSWHRLD